jgi:DNA invertase Pin-like site-specific DNA recombinase
VGQVLGRKSPGDTLIFTKLDRIGRSTKNLIDVTTELRERGVNIRSLDPGEIDTTTATGNCSSRSRPRWRPSSRTSRRSAC